MSGKVRNIRFSKLQLEKALQRKGKSKNDLYRYLISTGLISERQIKKNVSNESMSLPVLEECAKYLDISPDYLRNEKGFADYLETEEELTRYVSSMRNMGIEIDDSGSVIDSYDSYKETIAYNNAYDHFNKFISCLLPYIRFHADKYGDGNLKEYTLLDYAQQEEDLEYLINKPYQELVLKITPTPHVTITEETELDFSTEMEVFIEKIFPEYLREEFEHRQPFIDKFKTMSSEEILEFNGLEIKEENNNGKED